MNNHVYRTPFTDIERKKEVAKSKERRKEIHNFINYFKLYTYNNLNPLEKMNSKKNPNFFFSAMSA